MTTKRSHWLPARIAATALGLALSAGAATAQEISGGPDIGIIPGTSMSRDEFRARARAQLAAAALNAVSYLMVNGDYDPDYVDLTASPAGNLGLKNMFNGRPVQVIWFEPNPDSLTTSPIDGMPGAFDMMKPIVPKQNSGPLPSGDPGTSSEWQPIKGSGGALPLRVDPAAIRDFSGGDMYYFVKNDLLQLIMFAPDGTYFEWVDQVPNPNYRENLQTAKGVPFPEGVYAAQVLYYVGNLAPQYSNLVRYMSDDQTVPGASFPSLSAQQRLEMAGSVGVTVRNPMTRQPIKITGEPSPGDLTEAATTGGTVLKMWLSDGRALGLSEISSGPARPTQGQPAPKQPKPRAKPGTKPGGGRGGGAAPGGGRTR